MANPQVEMKAFLDGDAANLPARTTWGNAEPIAAIRLPYVQFAWDGTPTDADNREDAVMRVTVWAPKGYDVDAQDIAAGLRARLLRWSSPNTWRVDRGAGRMIGVDPGTKLPFCTFTVSLALHAVAP
jgi:hypothetical protein